MTRAGVMLNPNIMYSVKDQVFKCSREEMEQIIENTIKAATAADSFDERIPFGSEMVRTEWILEYLRKEEIYPVYRWYAEYQVQGEEPKRLWIGEGAFYQRLKDERDKDIFSLVKEGKIITSFRRVGVHPEEEETEESNHFYVSQREKDFFSLELAEMVTRLGYHSHLRSQREFLLSQCAPVREAIKYCCLSIVEEEYTALKALKDALKAVID